MLSADIQQKLIRETINSAVCIDNEYVGAYEDGGDVAKREDSRNLYESFRDSGLCHLDIYHFTDMAAYNQYKDKLLRNRDMVILDWELSDNVQCKYEDALAILDDVCQNEQIHFVDIYTQAANHQEIAHTIYSYFKLQKKAELMPHVDAVTKPMEELFNDFELEGFDAEVAKAIAKDVLRDFIMNPAWREKIQKEFIDQLAETYQKADGEENFKKEVCMKFKPAIQAKKEYFKDTLAFLRAYCICHLCDSPKVSQSGMMAKAVNPTTVLVNGTVVHVTSKGTIHPDGLFADLINAISGMPKHRSLLLSLLLKHAVDSNLASVGKALGRISEEALMAHCKTLEEAGIVEENVSNFVASALTEHVLYSFQNDESDFSIADLVALGEGEQMSSSEKEHVLEFNSMLTFIPKSVIKSQRHQIRTGDVFILNEPVRGTDDNNKNYTYQYILCITQSCDALRPFKVNNNLAFVFGEVFDSNDTVNKAETEYFTYLDNHTVIKWSKRFFTIYIADTKLSLDQGEGRFTFHYINGDFTATFLGTQKEAYTHRIINNVFSNAMRIGIDLPHK